MNNRELFTKDPLTWKLLNEGVTSNNSTDENTLRYELESFVCKGEYQGGLARILEGFLGNLGSDQKAVWVSGFYGSGKSHLVKVLRYLWTNKPFQDGSTPRALAHLPPEIIQSLIELNNKAKQFKTSLLAAGGTLKSGSGSVRLRLLGIVFNSLGIPEDISAGRLWLDLRKEGKLAAVQQALSDADKDPAEEFDKIYSPAFTKAYMKAFPDIGSVTAVKDSLRAQYPPNLTDITVKEMVKVLKLALIEDGKKLPLTVIVLDEVQQYINSSADIALDVQEAVEACCKEMEGRVLFVGTGQSALAETPALQRLMGRFTIKVPLKDNDVETVVRTVVLQKKDDKKEALDQEIRARSGEITRQLKGTRLATKPEDNEAYVPDYPLLPVRRRFWEKVLHHVDSTGTTAQMRTQLRVTHEACKQVANLPVGSVIPADFLYDQLAPELIQTGEIQKRFSEMIEGQRKKSPDGEIRSRICALAYLINKLPRQTGVDDGIRASVEHLADLLSDDLKAGVADLRQKLPGVLQALVAEGILMEVDGEYRLQTTEGANWEGEFRRRRTAALGSETLLATRRNQLLEQKIQGELGDLKVVHGASKVARKVALHHGQAAPSGLEGLVVWVRDGYTEAEASVIKDIQGRPLEDATLHVFIRKGKDPRSFLADAMAAEETLSEKGVPSTPEGQEARRAIETRSNHAKDQIAGLITEMFGSARVYLSGGKEIDGESPKQAVRAASDKVLNRLYPKFPAADHASWNLVWNNAKEGNPSAMAKVDYPGDADKHPVAVEILNRIGGGIKGSDLNATLTSAPFGWPLEAVAGTLAVLMVTGHLKASLQGKELAHGDLDLKKVGQCSFHRQHPVLTPLQLLKVRGLFKEAGTAFILNNEAAAAPLLVNRLKELAMAAGGEAPAPVAPQPPLLAELPGLSGNDLLFKLFECHEALTPQIKQWLKTAKDLKPRLAALADTRLLLQFAASLPDAVALNADLAAIMQARSVLHEPDPVAPIRQKANTLLEKSLKTVNDAYASTYEVQQQQVEASPLWQALPETRRAELLAGHGVVAPTPLNSGLLEELKKIPLETRRDQVEALLSRFQNALSAAGAIVEPKATSLKLKKTILKTAKDADAWLEQTKKEILQALATGSVIVG